MPVQVLRGRIKITAHRAKAVTANWNADMTMSPCTGAHLADLQLPVSAEPEAPFVAFIAGLQPQTRLRAAITAACRQPEADCLPPLLDLARLPAEDAAQ